ncbi:hypothetical protein ACOMHN_038787 [Nucella lapillus]
MYDGIKKALGPVQSDTGPPALPPTHTHPETQNTVSPSARDAIPCLPTMDELDADPALDELDADPALDELSKATDSLAAGKAPGSDGIPPDLLKHCKSAVFFHCSKSSVNVGRKARPAARGCPFTRPAVDRFFYSLNIPKMVDFRVLSTQTCRRRAGAVGISSGESKKAHIGGGGLNIRKCFTALPYDSHGYSRR